MIFEQLVQTHLLEKKSSIGIFSLKNTRYFLCFSTVVSSSCTPSIYVFNLEIFASSNPHPINYSHTTIFSNMTFSLLVLVLINIYTMWINKNNNNSEIHSYKCNVSSHKQIILYNTIEWKQTSRLHPHYILSFCVLYTTNHVKHYTI